MRDFSPAFQDELAELFRWRRDVRRFRTTPLPEGAVERLIGLASTAPSVGLSEPWRFVCVRDSQIRKQVIASFETCNAEALAGYSGDDAAKYASLKLAGLREAPAHLAIFCDEADGKGKGLGQATMAESRRYSVVCAVMQLWLAARAEGVGVGWVSILDPAEVSQAVGAAPDWRLVAYLCLGYPVETHLDCELERAGWEQRDRAAGRVSVV
jgi:5,6-dimethylbenzimidazole synthase